MEKLSTLLVLCKEKPPVTGGFPSQRASNAELGYFLCHYPEQIAGETVELPVIWDTITLMWRHVILANLSLF